MFPLSHQTNKIPSMWLSKTTKKKSLEWSDQAKAPTQQRHNIEGEKSGSVVEVHWGASNMKERDRIREHMS